MNKKLAQFKSQKGFTLIELLIVIVIIGILAGIVITILNPARQQARARDGVIVATMNKIAADVKAQAAADISGIGNLPTCATLAGTVAGGCTNGSLQNVTAATCTCTGGTAVGLADNNNNDNESFAITGVTVGTLPATMIGFQYRKSAAAANAFCLSAPANDTSTGSNYITYDPNNLSGIAGLLTPQRSTNDCW
ncbi:MAG: prepilin-type N-terminal cleavage/methylation domain-containing protein [Patescibacteria group bacterium]